MTVSSTAEISSKNVDHNILVGPLGIDSNSGADLNDDGRPDLLIAQNKGLPKLYLNVLGQAGMRVRLKYNGSAAAGQGAVLRSVYNDGSKGPARLGSGSSGRYSRNSDTQILGAAKRIRSVEVTWPSGIKSVEQVAKPALLLELGL